MCVKPYVGPDYHTPRSVEEAERIPLPWTNEVDPSYMPPPDVLIDE